jgi:putative phage-type endonuclease
MKIIDIPQGSALWHQHRRDHRNASDAPAMMGCSPYKSRAKLLHETFTGMTADVDAATQQRFDAGHRFEALARPLAEAIIGEELYPITVANGIHSASLDGATLDGQILFEHKTLNSELAALVLTGGDMPGSMLPLQYRVQMEQQLHCAGADRVLFMATKRDGDTPIDVRYCWYTGDMNLRAQILANWAQFERDLADYVPADAAPVVVAAAVESLPAVAVRMDGALVVNSNLPAFSAALRAYIERIPVKPSTDQDFANCEAACKALKKAEEALEAAESGALASMADVETMRRAVADCISLARTTRLASEKMVKARKEQIREDECRRGRAAFEEHIQAANNRLGGRYIANIGAPFNQAIHGLKTLESVRNAIDTALAQAKITISAEADKIAANLKALEAAGSPALFADRSTLVLRDADALSAIIAQRLAGEQQRQNAERERIRAEEQAKLEREAKRTADALAASKAESERLAALAEDRRAAAARLIEAPPVTVRVQACRPEDRTMLATPAGAELVTAVVAAMAEEPATLKLGTMTERLGFMVTRAFVESTLGIKPAATEKSWALWRESDWPRIKAALVRHIEGLQ